MPYLLAAVSGLMTALSASSEAVAALCFFAPSLFFAACKIKISHPSLVAFVYGASLWLGSSLWLITLFVSGFTDSVLLLVVALLGISAVGGAVFAFAFSPLKTVVKNGVPFTFAFSFLYIFAEYIPSVMGPLSYPWFTLASAVSPFTPFIQSASLLGSYFVSLIIVLINAFIAHAAMSVYNKKRLTLSLTLAVFVFTFNVSYGVCRLQGAGDGEKITVAAVQGNLGANNKWQASRKETLFLYTELTRLICEKASVDLVVLPETAYPAAMSPQILSSFLQTAKNTGTDILFGCFEASGDDLFNSATAAKKSGDISDFYRKRRLVPIGEYDPTGLLSADFIGVLSAGTDVNIIEAGGCKVGALICFESLFSALNRENVAAGADIIAVITNDSWFGSSSALYRHMTHAMLRAAETKRAAICAASTGITCVISPYGKITASVPANTAAAVSVETEKIAERTLFSSVGDIIVFPAILLLLLKIEFLLEPVNTAARIN